MMDDHPVYGSKQGLRTGRDELLHLMFRDADGEVCLGSEDLFGRLQTDFKAQDEDVWVLTYPKAGTTVMTEVLFYTLAKGDPEKAQALKKQWMSNNILRVELLRPDDPSREKMVAAMNKLAASTPEVPRVFCTHLQERHLPEAAKKGSKMIVMLRNPKDTVVSYYHFHRMNEALGLYTGTFSQFLQAFLENQLAAGSWFNYCNDLYSKHKNKENFLFLHYEDMLAEPGKTVTKVANFLNIELAQAELDSVVLETCFEKMDKREQWDKVPFFHQDISKFMRKGKVGDWRNHFTVEESDRFDEIYCDKMKQSELKFRFT